MSRKLAVFACSVALLVTGMAAPASAAITNVSVQISDPTPSATASYTWTWTGYQTAASVKCVKILMSVNADGTGGLPTGMGLGSTTLTGTFGGTWTRDATSVASGIVVFNWATGVTPGAGPTTLVLGAATNSSTAAGATYYETLTTYDTAGTGSSGACAGATRDAATVSAFETTPAQVASVTVDPSLSLTITTVAATTACGDVTTTVASTSNAIPLGHIAATTAHPIAGQNLNVQTNANGGYTTYISYSGAMTGAATAAAFTDMTGTNASPAVWPSNGTEAFGYTTQSASLSGTAGRFHTSKFAGLSTTQYELMRNAATPAAVGDTNCIAFEASTAGNTKADTYSTNVRYNVAGSF